MAVLAYHVFQSWKNFGTMFTTETTTEDEDDFAEEHFCIFCRTYHYETKNTYNHRHNVRSYFKQMKSYYKEAQNFFEDKEDDFYDYFMYDLPSDD